MLKRILAGLIGGVLLTGEATAGALEDGLAAYQRGDYAAAAALWKPLAEQGDAAAQTGVGTLSFLGKGMPEDFAGALKWYRLAADQGYAAAQHKLGGIYAAAAEGVSEVASQLPRPQLGFQVEAAKWFRLAADQGYGPALFDLGLMYGTGKGVPQDIVEAEMLLSLAVARGSRDAEGARDVLARQMTPKQIAEAQRRAREWKPK